MVECWKTHSNKKSDRCNLVKTRRRRITEWKECNCLIDDFIPFPCCLNRPAILQLTKHKNSNKQEILTDTQDLEHPLTAFI